MNVRQVPGESTRYFVESQVKPNFEYMVDMEYSECPGDMGRPMCGCWEMQAKGKSTCKHVKAVEAWLKGQHETTKSNP